MDQPREFIISIGKIMAENINFSKIIINMDAERECEMNMYALHKKRNLN